MDFKELNLYKANVMLHQSLEEERQPGHGAMVQTETQTNSVLTPSHQTGLNEPVLVQTRMSWMWRMPNRPGEE